MSEELGLLEELTLEEEDVLFEEEEHKYVGTVSGKEYISVTTLLKKFGLTPSEYAVIPVEILRAKADYGKRVHKALEEYIKGDETQLLVPEVRAFQNWLDGKALNILDCVAEKKVFNEYYGVAGTIDLQLWNIIADFKTTATLHLVPVMWQLSLYNYLLHPSEEDYNMFELSCFWFSAEGVLSVKEIPLIPHTRVTSLLEAYRRGESSWVDTSIPSSLIEKVDMIVKQKRLIDTLKTNLKALESEKEVLRVAIEEKMKEESRIYVDAPAGIVTITEVSTPRLDNDKVYELLRTMSLDKKDYMKVSVSTRFNIKDKGK